MRQKLRQKCVKNNTFGGEHLSWWTFRIFFFFSARERGRGVRGAGREGFLLFMENPMRGGLPGGWGRGGGAGRVFAGNLGGGLNIFFGAEMSTEFWTIPIKEGERKPKRQKGWLWLSCHPLFPLRGWIKNGQDVFDHDKGQKSAISWRLLHWILLSFLQWIFAPFLRFYCL